MAGVVSRKELARWASEVTGQRVTQLEKQCASGTIYCQLVEAARPGSVDMRKVDRAGDALGNYKALENALAKIGLEQARSMDIQMLQKGQPQATIDLLQTLHQALVGDDEVETPRGKAGLTSIDPNAIDGAVSSRKRKAALPSARPARKARSAATVDEQMAAAEEEQPPPPPPESSEPAPVGVEQAELEHSRARLAQSQCEVRNLKDEMRFYHRKLERIEDACQGLSPAKAPAAILEILYEEEQQEEASAEQ